jgi:16S rRNA (guanine527-N7)-methyltransferase
VDKLIAGAAGLGIHLTGAQLDQFRRYHQVLADWNSRVNLTSVTGIEEVQTTLFLDSLTVTQAIPAGQLAGGRFVDVGSGGGFPGVPLQIAFPGLRTTLIDSTAKKTAFLSELCQELGLDNVEVLTGRAETLAHDPELRESFDIVLARAIAGMAALAELTLPFCRTGGLVVAQKSQGVHEEVDRAARAVETVGGRVHALKDVTIPELTKPRCLVVLEKTGPAPSKYPRRPGMPEKRPL